MTVTAKMTAQNNDPRTNPALAARNRRTAIVLALLAVAVYVVFIVGTAL